MNQYRISRGARAEVSKSSCRMEGLQESPLNAIGVPLDTQLHGWAADWLTAWMNEWIYQSMNQSINQSINPSINPRCQNISNNIVTHYGTISLPATMWSCSSASCPGYHNLFRAEPRVQERIVKHHKPQAAGHSFDCKSKWTHGVIVMCCHANCFQHFSANFALLTDFKSSKNGSPNPNWRKPAERVHIELSELELDSKQ